MFAPKLLAGLLTFLLVAAGCLTDESDGTDGADNESDGPTGDYALDCSVGPGEGGDWWRQACIAFASPNPSPAKAEVDIAVNPLDPLNVVVASKDKDPEASNDCVWSVAQVTKDGGKNWTTVYVGGDKNHRVPETKGYECVTDPIMVFDSEGTFYYALQIYDHSPPGNVGLECPVPPPEVGCPAAPDTGSAFILARSRDGGLTYDKYALQAEGAGDLLFHDYPRMIVSPATGSVHTIWNAYIGTGPAANVRPVVSSTRDGGDTVDPPLYLHPADPQGALAFFSGFAATKEGTIYVTMQKNEDSDAGDRTTAWIWKSTDDAKSFQEVGAAFQIRPTPRQHGNHSFRTPSFVEMAIDASEGNHSGRIYTFWTDNRFDRSDVLSSHSDDGGVSWSEPVQVATQQAGGQYFVRPRVGPDGTVHVLFATQAYSGTEFLDQVHAWSRDGGQTWENHRLTTVSFDGDLGLHQNDFPFIGDYNGLVVGPEGTVHAAWGDTSTGRAEIAYARIVPSS